MRRHVLQCQGAQLQRAWARWASTSSGASQQPAVIPAEVAQLVAARGGMAALPPDVEAAVAAAAADSNRKAVKRRGQELAYRLRHMSRSKHRGGQHPNLSEQLAGAEEDTAAAAAARQRRGKRRQSRAAALEVLTRAAALPVEDASRVHNLEEVLGGAVADAVGAEEAAQAAAEREKASGRSSLADGGTLYDQPAALAYAASRMPACYAALHRALGEVAGRMPAWRPRTQLDFGAGPGTAVWAAQQVWRQAQLDALAVEPATAMSWLGHHIQQHQAAAYGAAAAPASPQPEAEPADSEEGAEGQLPAPLPRLRWMYKLPPRYRAAQGRQYDLVTAGYVLGELRSDAERRRLVQDLWERTGGVLVLVEPGTPAGAANIQRARSQLLEAVGLKQQQQQQQQQQVEATASAHVVAPCPHDGACPMEGTPSWCHFVQRFQRTELQRAAKATAGIQPRTYQDERFSYVAIARGPRPAAHTPQQQPLVAGSFMPSLEDPQEYLQLPDRLAPRKVPEDAAPMILYSDDEREVGEGEASDVEDWWSEEQGEEVAAERERGYVQDSSSLDDYAASSSSEEQDEGGGSSASDASGSKDVDEDAPLAGLDAATRRLLLDSVLAGAEEDEEDGGARAALAERLQQDLLASAAEQRQAAAAAPLPAAAAGRSVVVYAPVCEATADALFDGDPVDWEAAEAGAVAAARAASGAWARVIRAPRKRSGHVVLDLCSAAAPGSSSDGGPQHGVLLRQVVSRAASQRDAGGTAAYRLARKLRWGDLWPHHYQAAFRAEAPPAGGSQD